MWASTLWPFSSSTRNIAFGNGSTTVPSTRIVSSFGLVRTLLLHGSLTARRDTRLAAVRSLSIGSLAARRDTRLATFARLGDVTARGTVAPIPAGSQLVRLYEAPH